MTAPLAHPIADALERAADLIEPEGAWTQGEYARTVEGRAIDPESAAAACFCAIGAVAAFAGTDTPALHMALAKFAHPLPGNPDTDGVCAPYIGAISRWNDAPERTQAEVVQALREAAQLARKGDNR